MRPEQYLVGINMQIRVKENTAQFGKCGCGRSPTGYCMGWHGLNEQQLKEAQEKYQAQQLDNK
jgi:ABC-type phosphate transport system ATPase subunit